MAERPERPPRSKFSPEDDARLLEVIGRYGCKNWKEVARRMPGRSARQCRERWCNYINPDIQKLPWTPADDLLLTEKVTQLGTRWHAIMCFFPGRSKNEVRNRWFNLQRRIATIGIVPRRPAPSPPLEPDAFSAFLATNEKEEQIWEVLGFDYL
jgi:hypothetical protein